MQIQLYTQPESFENSPHFAGFQEYLEHAPNANYFQSIEFFRFIATVKGYRPFVLLALSDDGRVAGSLMGVIQSDGGGLKAWFSRRLIVWGGPVLAAESGEDRQEVARKLLKALKKHAKGNAIFIEFRNFFDCSDLNASFEASGFQFRPHLNYLVKTDDDAAVKGRMSSNRRRQIKTSLAAGAIVTEPESEEDVVALYEILKKLYKEKVKKPLPGPDLFVNMWKSEHAKVFLVKYEGQVVGGSIGPVFRNKVLYQWYICGENGTISGLHPSVLASWAPIEYGVKNGYDHFDFMGAGKPEEDYGVREFKARFGGEQVCYGRYEMVLNRSLYKVGKLGLKVYQTIR